MSIFQKKYFYSAATPFLVVLVAIGVFRSSSCILDFYLVIFPRGNLPLVLQWTISTRLKLRVSKRNSRFYPTRVTYGASSSREDRSRATSFPILSRRGTPDRRNTIYNCAVARNTDEKKKKRKRPKQPCNLLRVRPKARYFKRARGHRDWAIAVCNRRRGIVGYRGTGRNERTGERKESVGRQLINLQRGSRRARVRNIPGSWVTWSFPRCSFSHRLRYPIDTQRLVRPYLFSLYTVRQSPDLPHRRVTYIAKLPRSISLVTQIEWIAFIDAFYDIS